MARDEGGHFTDILVILIFVYLAGIATGILACRQRPTTNGKEEEKEPQRDERGTEKGRKVGKKGRGELGPKFQ